MTALRGGESGGGQVWNRDALVAALENLVTEATRAYERSRRTASDVEQIELLTQRDLAQGALFTAIEEASRANEEALAPIAAGLKAEADAIRGRLQVLRTAVQVVQLLAEVVGVATAIAQRVATSGAPVS